MSTELLLLEYEKLRDEVISLTKIEHDCVKFGLISNAGICAFIFQYIGDIDKSLIDDVLMIPVFMSILFLAYCVSLSKSIKNIGFHIAHVCDRLGYKDSWESKSKNSESHFGIGMILILSVNLFFSVVFCVLVGARYGV